jgi:hypothetical protein
MLQLAGGWQAQAFDAAAAWLAGRRGSGPGGWHQFGFGVHAAQFAELRRRNASASTLSPSSSAATLPAGVLHRRALRAWLDSASFTPYTERPPDRRDTA